MYLACMDRAFMVFVINRSMKTLFFYCIFDLFTLLLNHNVSIKLRPDPFHDCTQLERSKTMKFRSMTIDLFERQKHYCRNLHVGK
jgi:hypothetical protein